MRTGRMHDNPFRGIPALRERHVEEIVYLTPGERDAVLAAAADVPDGLAVWIALYAGLRRGEISLCGWRDLSLDAGNVVVPRSKTGRRRVVPLATALADHVRCLRPGRPDAYILPWRTGGHRWQWGARKLRSALTAACPAIPEERIRWNAFRHTFGSLLAQAGVSLDKVTAWMGNSPAVCRRHYAESIPRDRRDEEIDLL